MSVGCGDLITSSVLDCDNILQGGVGDNSRLILIPKSSIASYTKSGIGLVSAITLAANKSGYSIDGVNQSLKPKFELVNADSGQPLYKHIAEFFYFNYSQLHKNNMKRLANGRYVAIYSNAKADADAYEILGLDSGLKVNVMTRAPQESGGAVKFTLESPENEFEASPPATFDAGGFVASKTALEALLFLPTLTTVAPLAAAAAGGTALTLTGTNFFGGGTNSAVLAVAYVNNATGAVVNQTTFTVASTTSITMTSVAMPAGSYKVRVTTIKGVAIQESSNLIVT